MTARERYVVHATWSPRSAQWVLDGGGLGVHTAKRLEQAVVKMATLAQVATHEPIGPEDIDLQWHLPMSAENTLEVAQRTIAEARKMQRLAKAARVRAVVDLQETGLSVRDIGLMLGITHQRVAQIVKEEQEEVA